MRKAITLMEIIIAIPLVKCANQQQILNEYKEKCRSFGFVDGTAQFLECMEKQDLEQQRDSAILFSSPGWIPPWEY